MDNCVRPRKNGEQKEEHLENPYTLRIWDRKRRSQKKRKLEKGGNVQSGTGDSRRHLKSSPIFQRKAVFGGKKSKGGTEIQGKRTGIT